MPVFRFGRRALGAPAMEAGSIAPSHEPTGSEAGVSHAAVADDQPPAAPNAPSSPLWSLTDQEQRPLPIAAAEYIATHPSQEETYRVREKADTTSLLAQADRVLVVEDDEPLPDSPYREQPQPSAAEPETPRENRKGWWQRRFKT